MDKIPSMTQIEFIHTDGTFVCTEGVSCVKIW
jgi:hypothetical protein